MRGLIVFLVALGLGAWTVSGQEGAGRQELERRIAELTRLLRDLEARRPSPEAGGFLVTSLYDVADLVSPLRDEQLVQSNLTPSKYGPPEVDEPEARGLAIEDLVELIVTGVAPDSWSEVSEAEIQTRGPGRISVRNLTSVHAGISRLLERLRANLRRSVAVEVSVVALPKAPVELTEEQVSNLATRSPLARAHLVCGLGQQVVQRHGWARTYVAEYDVEIAQSAAIGDPVSREVLDGLGVEVRACPDSAGSGALLHCRLELTALESPTRRVETEHGPLQLPVLRLSRIGTTLWAPYARPVVAGGCTIGDRPCVFLLTARPVEPPTR